MASDFLLELEGIKGESRDDKHAGALELSSFSWGLSQTGVRGGPGGGGAGKASFQDFHFTKRCDKSSPDLFIRCASGEHIKKAVFFGRKSGGDDNFEYLKITLEDCLVSSYQIGGSAGSDVPTDQFSLNYTKVEFEYDYRDADGSVKAVKFGWNVKTNSKA